MAIYHKNFLLTSCACNNSNGVPLIKFSLYQNNKKITHIQVTPEELAKMVLREKRRQKNDL